MHFSTLMRSVYSATAIAFVAACSQSDDTATTNFTPGTQAPAPTPVPVTAPVASFLPANNQNVIPTNLAAVIVYFDQPIDVDTVSKPTLQISPAVNFTLEKSRLSDAKVALFNLQDPLTASTTYSLNTTGIVGANGLAVDDASWQFTTLTTADTTPPTIPTNLSKKVALSGTSVTLSWSASNDDLAVAGYRIYRNTSLVGVTATTGFTASIKTGLPYAFSVEAFDFADNRSPDASIVVSTGSIIDTTPPSAPENIEIPILTNTEAGLTWVESTDNIAVKGYNIYRDGVLVGTTGTTSYFDTGLTESTTYIYTVEAFDFQNNKASTKLVVTTKPVIDPTLTWKNPTRNEDNSCTMQLEGIRIYYGNRSRNYIRDLDIKLTDPEITCIDTGFDSTCSTPVSTCSYTPQVEVAKWYFVITVYNTIEQESLFSDQVFYDLTP